MKQLKQWLHAHPFKAVWFTFLFTLLPALIATVDRPARLVFIVLYFAFLLLFVSEFAFDTRTWTIILVAAGLAAPGRTAEEPKAAGTTAAIVVIVVGGVATYYLVKFCQKHFGPPPAPPKSTNDPPESAAAATFSALGSCYQPAADGPPPGLYEFGVSVTDDRVVGLAGQWRPADTLLSWQQFNNALLDHGIYLPPVGQTVYGTNGQPADAGSGPLSIALAGPVPLVTVAGGRSRTVVLERSADLSSWTTLCTNSVPVGMELRVQDEGAEQMFYRWREP